MNSETIIEVINSLTGMNDPIGDSSVDNDRLNNLKKKINITEHLLTDIYVSATYKDATEFSVNENGNLAYSFLVRIKDWIDETIEEIGKR